MTKLTFRLLELLLKYLGSNLYFGEMFDTFNCISSIECKRWMLRFNVGSNNDCSRTGRGPTGPSHGSAIGRYINICTPPQLRKTSRLLLRQKGMFTLLPSVSCRREQLRGIVRRPMNSDGTEQVVHIHPTFVPELVGRAPW